MSMLEVSDLVTEIHLRHSTVHAVDGVSLRVEAGETLGVVGESGCGKSMLASSIMSLLPPGGRIVSGSVRLDGRELVGLSRAELRAVRGREIGMIFQDPMTSLNPTMSIGRQIAEAVMTHRQVSRRVALARASEVLGLVGMPHPAERVDDFPHQLSGGLRQRVMIAMALACEPKLLIADEPTTALDVTIQAQILDLLSELKERLDMGVILITHDMGIIAEQADRTMVMYAGRVAEHSATGELFTSTRHPYTEALLGSIPRLDHDRSQVLVSIPGLPPNLTSPSQGCRFADRCRYVQDRCRADAPALSGDATHMYACFFPVGSTPQPAPSTALAHGASPATVHRAERSEAAEQSLLTIRGVTKEFAVSSGGLFSRKLGTVKAVSDVSFEIHNGETFGLIGESGCGKTTLGRMIAALDTPSAGEFLLGTQDIHGLGRRELRHVRADLQIMFQDPYASLDPRMRVGAIVREPLTIQRRGSRRERDDRTRELLSEVGLPPGAADRYPHEFSGGQRQRVGLARALALNPKLIVADEPVSALDVSIRSQILNLMRRLQRDHQLTYMIISHDLSVVRYMADRIGVMYLGKLVEIARSSDIYERAAHPYTQGLLAAIPVADPQAAGKGRGPRIRGEIPSPINPPSGCRFRTRCPRATDLCAAEAPPLRPFGEGHHAACHFPLQTPSTGTPASSAVRGVR